MLKNRKIQYGGGFSKRADFPQDRFLGNFGISIRTSSVTFLPIFSLLFQMSGFGNFFVLYDCTIARTVGNGRIVFGQKFDLEFSPDLHVLRTPESKKVVSRTCLCVCVCSVYVCVVCMCV